MITACREDQVRGALACACPEPRPVEEPSLLFVLTRMNTYLRQLTQP